MFLPQESILNLNFKKSFSPNTSGGDRKVQWGVPAVVYHPNFEERGGSKASNTRTVPISQIPECVGCVVIRQDYNQSKSTLFYAYVKYSIVRVQRKIKKTIFLEIYLHE